jgi:hypothetical protein
MIKNAQEVICWFIDMMLSLKELGAALTIEVCPSADAVWMYLYPSMDVHDSVYQAHFYICESMYYQSTVDQIQHDLLEYRERYKERAKA